ncbi:MAG: NAD-dependent deacylase [Candidatus Hydrogenedentes bacterium]|nr:NAD-dependent deacylase [Candidatus Hydrogenedentota bacterium]
MNAKICDQQYGDGLEGEHLDRAARALASARLAVAVTGAGISVESGIPDFRSADGLWSRYPPEEFATIEAFHDDPDRVWIMWYELAETLGNARPNPAHYALARLEKAGRLAGVITQNIDALHHRAGSETVVEFHGRADAIVCPACGRRRNMELSHRAHGAPRCECGGYMKPDVVLFGEMIPPSALTAARVLASTCDVMLVIGTSAQVYPAASLPWMARENGATIIECNIHPTAFTTSITDIFLRGPAGVVLPALADKALGNA